MIEIKLRNGLAQSNETYPLPYNSKKTNTAKSLFPTNMKITIFEDDKQNFQLPDHIISGTPSS